MNTSTRNTFTRSIRNALLGLATLGIIGAAGTAMAKGPGAHKLAQMTEVERAEHIDRKLDKRVNRMTEKLELSQTQADQVRVILEASMNQRVEIAAQSNGDKKAARTEFKALREQTRTQLSGVLTSEQLAELDQMKRERKGKKKGKGDRSGKRMQRMAQQLDLTPQQTAQIEQIRAESKLEAKQIIELAGSREDAKPELKLLRKQTRADIEAVLTPEQAEKFEQLRAERKSRRGKRGGEGKRGQKA